MEEGSITTDVCLKDEKIFFLKNQLWASTISASFSRGYIYKDFNEPKSEIDEKKERFKNEMFVFIEEELINEIYINSSVKSEIHIQIIYILQEWSKNYNYLLRDKKRDKAKTAIPINDRMLSFGICQKLLNLYLKYLWCANILEFEPPHFPLDRLIQRKLPKKIDLISWTKLENSDIYTKQINKLCTETDKAKWELLHYNEILRNG